MYTELHVASAFSFLEGASLPDTLIARAAALGYPALALLDRDGVYGAPQFYRAAKAAGLKAIVGADLTIDRGPGAWTLAVLVASAEGYRNLCKIITRAKLRAPKGEMALTLDDFQGRAAGLVALAGRALLTISRVDTVARIDRLSRVFGRANLWIEVQRHLQRDDQAAIRALLDLASASGLPVMASNGVRFATPAARPLFDVLTSIRAKTTLAQAGRRLSSHAERYLKSPDFMARLFADLPQALAGTAALAERLDFTLANLGYRFPVYPTPAGEAQIALLRRLTDTGARGRYRPYHDRARAQIARELQLIEKLDLAGYFLIVWDIVDFCRREGILVQGRGSAANSAVCYALGITAVDPVGMDLLFERFLSEERGEWPDIDLDLPSGAQRERVIQYVYERYGALGAAMTANVITYRGRSAAREVGKALELDAGEIDRLARMMGQFEFVDPEETIGRHLREAGLDPDDRRYRQFAALWREMQDLPRHLGQHSGGMVVCQGRLDEVVPLENAAMPGRVVVQWDKDDCADLGIVKVDLLGLGMMAVLEEAIEIVNRPPVLSPVSDRPACLQSSSPRSDGSTGLPFESPQPGTLQDQRQAGWSDIGLEDRRQAGRSDTGLEDRRQAGRSDTGLEDRRQAGRSDIGLRTEGQTVPLSSLPLSLSSLPPDDPAVYRMLRRADTVGVFQVESRAQMATLPRLRPKTFYDIVVEVAIIRPGPIVGRMVHPYLARRSGAEPIVYAHPKLEPVLARTLGVPLFQEQLLRMAMVVAGFSGGEAEELRRAMGFKRSIKRMQQIEQRLRTGMAANGITGTGADEIVQSITSFALYGFPESHAASFALLVYASAYLKAHFPSAFYTALLNNQPMGFYSPATLVKDAQRRGVRFAPVDVQISRWACVSGPDGVIRMGLRYVKGLREEAGRRIEDADNEGAGRTRRFTCLDDLVTRARLRQDEIRMLAEAGALAPFGGDRRTALWQAERAGRPAGPLVADEPEGEDAGAATTSPLPLMSLAERVRADYDTTGLTIGPHPMAFVRPSLATAGVTRAIDLPRGRAGRRARAAGAVIVRQRPGAAKGFVFLSLEDETGIANVIITPDVFAAYKRTIVDEPYLLVEGELQNQSGAVSIKARRVEALRRAGPDVDAHDFH